MEILETLIAFKDVIAPINAFLFAVGAIVCAVLSLTTWWKAIKTEDIPKSTDLAKRACLFFILFLVFSQWPDHYFQNKRMDRHEACMERLAAENNPIPGVLCNFEQEVKE